MAESKPDSSVPEAGPPSTPVTDEMVRRLAVIKAALEVAEMECVKGEGTWRETCCKLMAAARPVLFDVAPLVPSERRVAELQEENERWKRRAGARRSLLEDVGIWLAEGDVERAQEAIRDALD